MMNYVRFGLLAAFCIVILGATKCEEYELNEDFEDFVEQLFECEEGEYQECHCADGEVGVQLCDPENSGWHLCVCEQYCANKVELCDGKDNNCNGIIDEKAVDTRPWFLDADSDGYGNSSIVYYSCLNPGSDTEFYSLSPNDCDDANPLVNPGMTEVCDGINNDCDADTDECPNANEVCDAVDTDGTMACVAK